MTRRQFFGRTATGIGALALASLLNERGRAASTGVPGTLPELHFAPRAKRIIYLFMQGGPSQMDLFDYKPTLAQRHGEELPDSVRKGQRITGMTAKQTQVATLWKLAAAVFEAQAHGLLGFDVFSKRLGSRLLSQCSAGPLWPLQANLPSCSFSFSFCFPL